MKNTYYLLQVGVVMQIDIKETLSLLQSKDSKVSYKALQELQQESEKSDSLYSYMDMFFDMLDSENSYVRTRGILLIAYNSKWDVDNKIDEIIDKYLEHISDIKPITARQCIKVLPIIVSNKVDLKNEIILALKKADISKYKDSMLPLVQKDIDETLKRIACI